MVSLNILSWKISALSECRKSPFISKSIVNASSAACQHLNSITDNNHHNCTISSIYLSPQPLRLSDVNCLIVIGSFCSGAGARWQERSHNKATQGIARWTLCCTCTRVAGTVAVLQHCFCTLYMHTMSLIARSKAQIYLCDQSPMLWLEGDKGIRGH